MAKATKKKAAKKVAKPSKKSTTGTANADGTTPPSDKPKPPKP